MYERSGTTIYVNFQHLMEFDGVLAQAAPAVRQRVCGVEPRRACAAARPHADARVQFASSDE